MAGCGNDRGESVLRTAARKAQIGTQKSSGYGIGNLAESEWRISAGFREMSEDGFSAWADFGRRCLYGRLVKLSCLNREVGPVECMVGAMVAR